MRGRRCIVLAAEGQIRLEIIFIAARHDPERPFRVGQDWQSSAGSASRPPPICRPYALLAKLASLSRPRSPPVTTHFASYAGRTCAPKIMLAVFFSGCAVVMCAPFVCARLLGARDAVLRAETVRPVLRIAARLASAPAPARKSLLRHRRRSGSGCLSAVECLTQCMRPRPARLVDTVTCVDAFGLNQPAGEPWAWQAWHSATRNGRMLGTHGDAPARAHRPPFSERSPRQAKPHPGPGRSRLRGRASTSLQRYKVPKVPALPHCQASGARVPAARSASTTIRWKCVWPGAVSFSEGLARPCSVSCRVA